MLLSRHIIAILLITTSLTACHTTNELSEKGGLFRTLTAALTPDASVVRTGDTIRVIYPELAMFDFGKDEIKSQARPRLVRFASVLKNYPNVRILVNGYTDNVGTEDANIDLSRRRAVKAYNLLSDNGVEASRMNTTGYGPQNPIQPNTTEEGRAANRRVEFMLFRQKKS
jgi:outer membrane protein OmpA-like peptidoglycan-associated protein